MPAFKIDTSFGDATLPVADADTGAVTLAAAVKAISGLDRWYQAETSRVNLVSSDIDSFIDIMGSGDLLTAKSSGQRAALDAATLNGFGAAALNNSEHDYYRLAGTQPDWTNPYSILSIFKLNSTTINRGIWGNFTSASIRSILIYSSTDHLSFQHGTSSVTATIDHTAWHVATCSFDGTNMKMQVDGLLRTQAVSGTAGSQTLVVGGIQDASDTWNLDGWISDIMIFSKDILASGNADDFAAIKTWISEAYGLTA